MANFRELFYMLSNNNCFGIVFLLLLVPPALSRLTKMPVFTLLVEVLVFKMNTKQRARDGTRAGFLFCFVLILTIEIHIFFWGNCPSDHCKPAFNYPALKKLILTFLAMFLVLQETWPLQRYRLQHSNGYRSFCTITVARSFACRNL